MKQSEMTNNRDEIDEAFREWYRKEFDYLGGEPVDGHDFNMLRAFRAATLAERQRAVGIVEGVQHTCLDDGFDAGYHHGVAKACNRILAALKGDK